MRQRIASPPSVSREDARGGTRCGSCEGSFAGGHAMRNLFGICLVLGAFVLETGCSDPADDETSSQYESDVRTRKRCGNGVCGAGETCSSCPQDCGTCPAAETCGNGVCGGGETCSSCSQDCGPCPTDGGRPPPTVFESGPQSPITCP